MPTTDRALPVRRDRDGISSNRFHSLQTMNMIVRDASLPDESYGIMVADAILEIHIAWRDAMRLFCHGGFGVRCAER